jgi:hypothetical protein
MQIFVKLEFKLLLSKIIFPIQAINDEGLKTRG